MTKSIAIGIDLGTTNSCVAVVQNGQVEAIQNDAERPEVMGKCGATTVFQFGHRTTPSCVAFKGELIMVGDSAHEQADTNPTNTIYSAKRMIGQRYSEIQDDLPYWSFTVKEDQEERPQIEVDFQDRKKLYRPEEISAKVLAQMKEIAETKLSNKVTDAVISVPAYFNDSQRQATKNAATMAGLNVIRIINEPTAAAIEYGLYQKASDDVWNVLVFDLGGGTFDVSVLTMEKDKYTVKATTGERRLGGDDFDQKLVEYCAKEFMQKYNSDIMSDMKARHRLLVACEKAKRTLSTQMQANVTVAYHGIEHSMQITRDVLDDLCRELFNKAMKLVEQALTEAKLTKDEINDIIVVGGSTRIPKVQKMLRSCFNNKKLNKSSNPDEVVARGAAYEAAMLHGQTTKILELTDVAPLSLGVEEIGGVMRKIIAANTQIPCSGSNQFFRVGTDDTQVTIRVFQGESIWTAENQFLGAFVLTGLPPIAEEGSDEIVVTFSIDRNGIISATAVNKSKDAKEGKITIKEPVCAVNKSDIARMIEEGDRQAALNGCRRKLENCLDDMREEMEKLTNMSKISPEDQVSFKTKADEVKDLLVNRSSATRIQYERAKEELEKLCIEIQERSQNMSLVAQLKSLFF